ncbi:YqgE/AlgH family protein [Sphingosinicellaceae bacterium]|nr:YqgE/AlgH family protein [Sphingosinicellaceae bacterium]
MEPPRYLVGQLLLSMPGIGDPRFERAVIAICVHDDDGAFGIVINNPLPALGVRELMTQLEVEPQATPEVAVRSGGPVEPGRGFVIHSLDWTGQSSIDVAGQFALTSTLDVLKAIADGTGPSRWVSALGYTGWDAGQLDEELTRHGWHSVPGDDKLIFGTPPEKCWPHAFAMAGINVGQLSASAGRA